MTRKKFIKLMMAFWVPRNQAVECADFARSHDIPYEDFYMMFREKFYTEAIKGLEQYILYGTDRTKWVRLRKEDLTWVL